MHRPIFGHSFAVLVAPVLLSVLVFYFLNKKRTSARRNAEDVDTGASGSTAAPTEANSDGSSPSPTKANIGASSSMAAPAETNSDGYSPSPTKANNDASSSLSGNCYEVFLSFRGPDTRHGFTDHLYKGLVDVGIDAFRDDDELCHGEDIKPVLMKAIASSKILIPIFSENYGTSSWCLDELVQIMERKNKNGQMVLPIFYKVKPADVGHQIGSFGETFHKCEKRLLGRSSFDAVTLEKWKKALLEVSTLKGYEAQGSEVELVKSIVRKVLNELKKKFELDIFKNLVGIDVHVKKVMEFVDNKSHDTLFVGIHGMGGIGKTTLAKAIYNKLFDQFEHCSFIADIRESWKRNGVHYLQNQLIYDILKLKDEVCNGDAGTKFISSKFKTKKVLVLLDDVDDVIQLQSLAGNRDWFSLGSKIIITTRNKRVLEEAGVDHDYEHNEMDYNQSLILFSKHAFRRDSPLREFEDLIHEVVSIAGGLPLSLEVFGSLLCGKESRQWRDTIKKLKKVPPKKVQEKLRISYEVLDYGQKQIFLDIACLFIGTNNIIASYMWDACDFYPGEGIEVLIFMSLLKVGDDQELRMHDQLRDLGREIVREENQREPWCRSRLWDYDEAQKVLKGNKGTDKIEAINLSEVSAEDFDKILYLKKDGDIYTEKQFKNLTNLRYLHMINAHLSGDFKDLMKGLKWLRWQKCPASFEVNTFDVKELAILELQGSMINEKWEGWSFFKMAEKLNYLDLSFCNSLEKLDLPKFGRLKELKAQGCENLAKIQGLDSLEYLESLDISQCTSIGWLDLPKFGMLKKLKAWCCKNLAKIQGLNSLEYLESLDIQWCTSMERLDLPIFGRLKELEAQGCENLAIIQGLNSLKYLERLDISRCTSIGWLDLPKFGMLKKLKAWCCKNLAEIQGLNSLEYLESLDISQCTSIERLLLPKSKSLKILEARDCENLVEIQGLDRLEFLEELNIIGCKSLKTIPELFRTRIYRHYHITDGRWSEPNPYYMYDLDEGSTFSNEGA